MLSAMLLRCGRGLRLPIYGTVPASLAFNFPNICFYGNIILGGLKGGDH
jgi:hypothetical protein